MKTTTVLFVSLLAVAETATANPLFLRLLGGAGRGTAVRAGAGTAASSSNVARATGQSAYQGARQGASSGARTSGAVQLASRMAFNSSPNYGSGNSFGSRNYEGYSQPQTYQTNTSNWNSAPSTTAYYEPQIRQMRLVREFVRREFTHREYMGREYFSCGRFRDVYRNHYRDVYRERWVPR